MAQSSTSVRYALAYLAAVRAGGCAAPLTTSATPEQLNAMLRDSGAMHLFVDHAKLADLAGEHLPELKKVMLENIFEWMADESAAPEDRGCTAADPFNIIYSSGTTGTPKGIVQSHGMRWKHVFRGDAVGYAPGAVTLLSTPLYSNTTLVVFFPTLAGGGTVETGYINPEEPYIEELGLFIAALQQGDKSIYPNTLLADHHVLDTLNRLEALSAGSPR